MIRNGKVGKQGEEKPKRIYEDKIILEKRGNWERVREIAENSSNGISAKIRESKTHLQ